MSLIEENNKEMSNSIEIASKMTVQHPEDDMPAENATGKSIVQSKAMPLVVQLQEQVTKGNLNPSSLQTFAEALGIDFKVKPSPLGYAPSKVSRMLGAQLAKLQSQLLAKAV